MALYDLCTVLRLRTLDNQQFELLNTSRRWSCHCTKSRAMRVILVGLLVAGCHGGDPDIPDATPQDSSLTVVWAPVPALPGDVDGSQLTVSAATVKLDRFQVIGDAGPGDPRTTRESLTLLWDEGHSAAPIVFDDAPPGLYSLISFELEGETDGSTSYDIRGTVDVEGTTRPYHVSDEAELRVSLPCEAHVRETENTTITIRVRLDEPLKGVDFAALPNVNGTLELDSASSQISQFRSALVGSFELGEITARQ
jgi:hypothetical protein